MRQQFPAQWTGVGAQRDVHQVQVGVGRVAVPDPGVLVDRPQRVLERLQVPGRRGREGEQPGALPLDQFDAGGERETVGAQRFP